MDPIISTEICTVSRISLTRGGIDSFLIFSFFFSQTKIKKISILFEVYGLKIFLLVEMCVTYHQLSNRE